MIVAKPIVPARWRAEFLSNVSKLSSPEFVLSTIHHASVNNRTLITPRARYCIFRGFWGELHAHRKNPAELNESIYQSELLTMTTDVRMCKIPEIFASKSENGNVNMSGGGGPVEAVFWVKDTGIQWRILGEAYVVGNDIDDESSSGAKLVQNVIGERMRLINAGSKDKWCWSRELTAHFGNLSPDMRGTFKSPAPGTPVSDPLDNPKLRLGEIVEDLHDELARKNFRVIIIKPEKIEKLDLHSPPETRRRTLYTYVGFTKNGPSDGWDEEECWP